MNDKRNIFPFILLGLAVVFIGFGVYNLNKMPASPYPEIRLILSLHSVNGPFSIHDLNGKVGVVYFGYTHCPKVCPATLASIGAALKHLDSAEKSKVEALFITTDPERDTPAHMAKFLRHFGSGIMGLSGSEEEIMAAAKSFMVGYVRGKHVPGKADYTVIHSSSIYILRPDGKLGQLINHNSTPKEITSAIRRWTPWAKGL